MFVLKRVHVVQPFSRLETGFSLVWCRERAMYRRGGASERNWSLMRARARESEKERANERVSERDGDV